MRIRPIFFSLLLLNCLPALAEAAKPLEIGDRVLVTGRLHRKCSARVDSLPSAGYARLSFDRIHCGDSESVYELKKIQRLNFVESNSGLSQGDAVVVNGHLGAFCGARVREVSKSGYVAVDFDSLLCADTESLFRAADLKKVQFVDLFGDEDHRFSVGQKVSVPGIREGDLCHGEIRKLTDSGLAQVSFEELTCAYGGKFYSLDQLTIVKPAVVRKHASGELIFQRVMREIASRKKSKTNDARL